MQTKKVSVGVYMYVHMCVITINENSGRALEREQGEMYGRKQKEKMMQRCSVSKNKRSNFKKEGFLLCGALGSLIPTLSKGQLHSL